MNNNLKNHWENIYEKKNEDEVSWFQQIPNSSIKLIKSTGIVNPKIIDVGSGRSKLLKSLIDSGYNDLTYLDISEAALKKSKEFLGDQSNKVKWITEDILNFKTEVKFDVWHDRAVFHFLTEQNLIDKYVELVSKNISNSGHLIIGTFSENGPLKCSGLEIKRYSVNQILDLFKETFELVEGFKMSHKTPFDSQQSFTFCVFKKGC